MPSVQHPPCASGAACGTPSCTPHTHSAACHPLLPPPRRSLRCCTSERRSPQPPTAGTAHFQPCHLRSHTCQQQTCHWHCCCRRCSRLGRRSPLLHACFTARGSTCCGRPNKGLPPLPACPKPLPRAFSVKPYPFSQPNESFHVPCPVSFTPQAHPAAAPHACRPYNLSLPCTLLCATCFPAARLSPPRKVFLL